LFGLIEEDRLPFVAAIPEVSGIHAVEPPKHRTAGGEGDMLINAPSARTGYGFDGSVPLTGLDIKVGIISDGVANLMAMHPQLLFFSAAGNDAETHQQMQYTNGGAAANFHLDVMAINSTGATIEP